MGRSENAQVNIRSAFVRDRVTALVQRTGMTATQIVEEALRAYTPPAADPAPAGLVRRGPLLVVTGGRRVTRSESDEVLEKVRLGERED